MRIGQVVTYTLSEADVRLIIAGRAGRGPVDMEYGSMVGHANPITAGQRCAAMIVADNGGSVNLQVMLDGDDSYWATSRNRGSDPGCWTD
jgi:hypothetical protein